MLLEREKLYTAEECFEFAALPENENRRLALGDGVIVDMASFTPINTVTAMRIGHFLNAFVIPRDLGYMTGADGGFKLSEKRVRQPDVSFISKAHIGKLPNGFNLAPDLAVEIVSPDEDIFKKAREYFQAGTQMVWVVYSDERMGYVMTPQEDGALLSVPFDENAVLDGGAVLPGFTLPVRDSYPQ
jgi:Uma2 family endonuclease